MSNRPLHSRIINILVGIYKTLRFSYHQLKEKRRYKNYYYPYNSTKNGKIVNILANGPSLSNEVNTLLEYDDNIQTDTLVVNSFALTKYFTVFKPIYYCLAEPTYFCQETIDKDICELFSKLNQVVDWSMTLFVPNYAVPIISKRINNIFITIEGLTTLRFEGFEPKRYLKYKKGIAVPSFVNVTIMALYALLNKGYSKIYLYGVDHSFLAGLCVNDNNRLCLVDYHFYGINKIELPPWPNGKLWRMKDFVYDKYLTFVEHEVMRGYADYLGAEIINCTKDSWIDAYIRKSQL